MPRRAQEQTGPRPLRLQGAVLLAAACVVAVSADVWTQEVGSQMEIGASGDAYKSVQLRCGADYMEVAVETARDFDGVIYTRGSFHTRESPCFVDCRGGRDFSLRFPLDRCHTQHEADTYRNVVVVQHDDELIMPGDAAFTLECDFSRPRDVTVGADLSAGRAPASSRISLADADPAGGQLPRHRRASATSRSPRVTLRTGDGDGDGDGDGEDDAADAQPRS